jgi:hypothetical protein
LTECNTTGRPGRVAAYVGHVFPLWHYCDLRHISATCRALIWPSYAMSVLPLRTAFAGLKVFSNFAANACLDWYVPGVYFRLWQRPRFLQWLCNDSMLSEKWYFILWEYMAFCIQYMAYCIQYMAYCIQYMAYCIQYMAYCIQYMAYCMQYMAYCIQYLQTIHWHHWLWLIRYCFLTSTNPVRLLFSKTILTGLVMAISSVPCISWSTDFMDIKHTRFVGTFVDKYPCTTCQFAVFFWAFQDTMLVNLEAAVTMGLLTGLCHYIVTELQGSR